MLITASGQLTQVSLRQVTSQPTWSDSTQFGHYRYRLPILISAGPLYTWFTERNKPCAGTNKYSQAT